MAKGYIVSIHNKIIDEEKLKIYGANAKPALEANGGQYVARVELEESSRPAYIRHLNMIKHSYGNLTLNQFNREKIIEFRESLMSVVIERKGNGLGKIRKPKTVNRHIASVQSLFTAATKDWGWYEKMNPCSQIRQLSEGEGVARDPLTPQEIMRL